MIFCLKQNDPIDTPYLWYPRCTVLHVKLQTVCMPLCGISVYVHIIIIITCIHKTFYICKFESSDFFCRSPPDVPSLRQISSIFCHSWNRLYLGLLIFVSEFIIGSKITFECICTWNSIFAALGFWVICLVKSCNWLPDLLYASKISFCLQKKKHFASELAFCCKNPNVNKCKWCL